MAGRKRANGEGTIYRRSDGRYEGAAVVPVIGGGRRRIRVYAATRGEARAKLDRLLEDARQSIPRSTQKQTVAEYLVYWLKHVVKPELRATTYNGYEIMVRLHITPALGRRYLADLSPADVRRMLAELRVKDTDGRGGGPRKLSPRMVQFAHAVLRNALSNAVREELVSRNVAKMVRTSTPDYDVGAGLDPIAARALLNKIRDDRLYALYLCAVVLGLRRGELLGLTWSAVNLDGAVLAVRQTLNWVNGQRHIQPPKTRASKRLVPLPDIVVDAFRDHQKRQAEECVAAGARWVESGFVFTTQRGEPMSPFTLTKYWHDVRAAAGLDSLRFHDLRHTAVSLLLALGIPPHVVKEIAGHSDIKVTMTVYAHGHMEEKAAALGQLGIAMAGTLPSTVAVNGAAEKNEDRPTAP